MRLTRRGVLAGTAALAGCGRSGDGRGDVLAAGQPAAILVLALAPDRLIGWPRRPPDAALALLPAEADLPQTGALASSDAPAGLEAAAALRPRLILDYGDIDARRRAIASRIETRLGATVRLIDGALERTPDALVEAGEALGARNRAARLEDRARAVLDRWVKPAGTGPRFYYARGADGLETGFAGSLATEVLEGAGWTNVAVGGRGIGRVTREQVAAWAPEVVVTLDRGFAAAADDSAWRDRRVLVLPDLPFGWVDRPPSLNRLLGCAWMAQGAAGARGLAEELWGLRAGAVLPEPEWRA